MIDALPGLFGIGTIIIIICHALNHKEYRNKNMFRSMITSSVLYVLTIIANIFIK